MKKLFASLVAVVAAACGLSAFGATQADTVVTYSDTAVDNGNSNYGDTSNPTFTAPALAAALDADYYMEVTSIAFGQQDSAGSGYCGSADTFTLNGITSDAAVTNGTFKTTKNRTAITYSFSSIAPVVKADTAYAITWAPADKTLRYIATSGTCAQRTISNMKWNGTNGTEYRPATVVTGKIAAQATISGTATWGDITWKNVTAQDSDYITETTPIVITVDADTTLTMDKAVTVSSATFLVADDATLTISGSAITALKGIVIRGGAVKVSAANILNGTIGGDGMVIYDGVLPTTDSFTKSSWSGTVWLKNKTGIAKFNIGAYGNANSKLKLTGVSGYLCQGPNSGNYAPEIGEVILEDDGRTAALSISDGYSDQYTKIPALSGAGTLAYTATGTQQPIIWIVDMSEFTGAITETSATGGFRIWVSDNEPSYGYRELTGSLQIDAGKSVTVPSDKTWTFSNNGFIVKNGGKLVLAEDATISGSVSGAGTIKLETVDNIPTEAMPFSTWTGKVEFPATDGELGDLGQKINWSGIAGSTVVLNDAGTTGSKAKGQGTYLNGSVTVVPNIEVKGTVYLNNGGSNASSTIPSLSGEGTLIMAFANKNTITINKLDNFKGTLATENANDAFVFKTVELSELPTIGSVIVKLGTMNGTVTYPDMAVTVNGESVTGYTFEKTDAGIVANAAAAIDGVPYTSLTAAIADADYYDEISLYSSVSGNVAINKPLTIKDTATYLNDATVTLADGVTVTVICTEDSNRVLKFAGNAGTTNKPTLIIDGNGANDWGMTASAFSDIGLVVTNTTSVWLDNVNGYDASVDLEVAEGASVVMDTGKTFTVGNLTGSGTIVKRATSYVNINVHGEDVAFSGTSETCQFNVILPAGGSYTSSVKASSKSTVEHYTVTESGTGPYVYTSEPEKYTVTFPTTPVVDYYTTAEDPYTHVTSLEVAYGESVEMNVAVNNDYDYETVKIFVNGEDAHFDTNTWTFTLSGLTADAEVTATGKKTGVDPVDPGVEKSYDTAEAAVNAVAVINGNKPYYINVPACVPTAKTSDYLDLFAAKIKDGTTSTVVVDFTDDAVTLLEDEADTAVKNDDIADPTATTATISARVGLYYTIAGCKALTTFETEGVNGTSVQAEGSTVTLTKPTAKAMGATDAAFYKVRVSAKALQ